MNMEIFDNNEKEHLLKCYNQGKVREGDLSFGRIMPFGKYKGKYIYHLLVKHHRYMDWIVKNTQFKLNETETWWKAKIDDFIDDCRCDRLIQAISPYFMTMGDMGHEDNPHAIIE